MPIEQADNTRVVKPMIPDPAPERSTTREFQIQNQPQLYDADKVQMYRNMQNLYNTNYLGYGVERRPTNYDPRTPEGQAAIQSNYNYTKGNLSNFAMNLITGGAAEGVGQVTKYLATPLIDKGVESVVKISKWPFGKVIKNTQISPAQMHIRTQTPGALKTKLLGKAKDGYRYAQSKVRKVSGKNEERVLNKIEDTALQQNWKRISLPNYDGRAYFKNGKVYLDLEGNVGETMFLKRPVNFDPTILDYNEALLAFKFGGNIDINNN